MPLGPTVLRDGGQKVRYPAEFWCSGDDARREEPVRIRLWTTLLRDHNAAPEAFALTLWNVPAEKRYDIRRLFEAVRDFESPFWTLPPGPAPAACQGYHLGIPHRSPDKFASDFRNAVRFKVRQKPGLEPLT